MQIDMLINAIKEAGVAEIDELLAAVMRRKQKLYPEWEIIYYAQRKGEVVDVDRILKLIGQK